MIKPTSGNFSVGLPTAQTHAHAEDETIRKLPLIVSRWQPLTGYSLGIVVFLFARWTQCNLALPIAASRLPTRDICPRAAESMAHWRSARDLVTGLRVENQIVCSGEGVLSRRRFPSTPAMRRLSSGVCRGNGLLTGSFTSSVHFRQTTVAILDEILPSRVANFFCQRSYISRSPLYDSC